MALTDKRRAFAEAYLEHFNATKAALKAGYSKKTAGKIGYNLLQDPDVQEHIKEAQKRTAELAGISSLWLAKRLKAIADADMKDFVQWDEGNVKLKKSDDVDGKLVAKVSQTQNGQRIELHDPLRAADMIAKMFGFYAPEKHDLNVIKSHEDALNELEETE